MSKIITVEDYNSALTNFNNPIYYEVDTTPLQDDTTYSIDFVEVRSSRLNGRRTYSLKIKSDFWNGRFYISNMWIVNPPQPTSSQDYDLIFDISEYGPRPVIGLILVPFHTDFQLQFIRNSVTFLNEVSLNRKRFDFKILGEGATDYNLTLYDTSDNEIVLTEYSFSNPNLYFEWQNSYYYGTRIKDEFKLTIFYQGGSSADFYFQQKSFKKPPYLKLWDRTVSGGPNVKIGVVNEMYPMLLYDTDSEHPIKMVFDYYDKTETVIMTDTIPNVNIDLRDKRDLSEVKVNAYISDGLENYEKEFVLKLIPTYVEARNNNIRNLLENVNETNIFEIKEDLVMEGEYYINHNVTIKGDNHNISSEQGYTFIVEEGITVNIENLNFENADTCFIQKNNSNLTIENSTFENCRARTLGGLGSIVHCNINLESLEESEDFITTIKNSNFINCYGAIYHGGQIIIDKCNYLINDVLTFIKNQPYFIFQVDGNCIIENSQFDMHIDRNNLCNAEINANLGQCLLMIGENAIINGNSSKELNEENLNFFDNPYNNSSHIFLKYYYPPIEKCVYVSPVSGKESKCLCYAINGVDYIFKYNAQITNAEWGTENRINPLNNGE